MVHVTEKNVAIIDVDLLIHECLRANEGKKAFAHVISPFISDFEISPAWLRFVSNIINVSDIDTYVDLIGLLRHHAAPVWVVTRSPRDLAERTSLSRRFIERQARTLMLLKDMGCEIKTNSSLHAKVTLTSRGVLAGSFNLTKSGRMFNLETGFYFPNTSGMEKKEYEAKLKWSREVLESSEPLRNKELEFSRIR